MTCSQYVSSTTDSRSPCTPLLLFVSENIHVLLQQNQYGSRHLPFSSEAWAKCFYCSGNYSGVYCLIYKLMGLLLYWIPFDKSCQLDFVSQIRSHVWQVNKLCWCLPQWGMTFVFPMISPSEYRQVWEWIVEENLLNIKIRHQQLEACMVSSLSATILKCSSIKNRGMTGSFLVATFLFEVSYFHSKTDYLSYLSSGVINCVQNMKSTQHKHDQQTWGGTIIQRRPAPIRTVPPPHYWLSNGWWHQSRFSDCLVRDWRALPRCNLTMEKTSTETTHTHILPHPYRRPKDEDERGRQSRDESEVDD